MIIICIDARMINNSGIGVYIKNFIKYISKSGDFEVVLIGKKNDLKEELIDIDYKVIEFDCPIYSIKEQIFLPFLIPYCDIFWSPHYNIPILPIRAKKRLVTIPDAAHLALQDIFKFGLIKKLYVNIVFKAATWLSDKITTISNFSRSEIIKYTNIPVSKISVIHLGIDKYLFSKEHSDKIKQEILDKYNLPANYILYVGNVKPHKNLRSLILAFDNIKNNAENHQLVIVGKKEGFITGDNEVFLMMDELKLNNRISFTGYVLEQDLPLIYSFASIFVFPSLYEGFGFPPLEAMACGCPVIVSNAASMPEVCGSAAMYVNPNDHTGLSMAILELVNDSVLRSYYIEQGTEHFKKFTWEKSGREFLQILYSLT